MAEGSEGVQGHAAGIKFYGGDDNKAFFGTKAKPGPLANTVQEAIDIWSSHGKLQVKTTPADLIRLQLRRRLMASFLDAYVAPKKDIPRRAYLTVSTLVAASILALWCALSYGGVVRSDFLPTPDEVATAAINGMQ